jgi:uncharacterized HhH-GPD family protein
LPLWITGVPAADELLNHDGLALLIGMQLDQQVPMEWAFKGPYTLSERLGGLDAAAIAAEPVQPLLEQACAKPAIHRFPASMAHRIHELCTVVATTYGNDAASIWTGVTDGALVFSRLRALPGFGEEKAQIFLAMLAKRFDIRPDGWEVCVGAFADDVPRTIADIDSPEALVIVREYKRRQKAAELDKQDRPAKPPKPKVKPVRNPPPKTKAQTAKAKSTKQKGRPRPNAAKDR